MKAMRPLCLVFDLDDTLYLERDFVRSGFDAVGAWAAGEMGIADFASRAWRLFESGQRQRVFDTVLREAGCDPSQDLIAQMVAIYRGHAPRISLLPDAKALLRELHGRCAMALISDGYLNAQQRKAEVLQVGKVLDPLVFTDCWGREHWKPHPRAFEFLQRRFGAREFEFVYVADNPAKDFVAPSALGWRTVRVRRPQGLHAGVERGPGSVIDFEIRDLGSLPELLFPSRRPAAQAVGARF